MMGAHAGLKINLSPVLLLPSPALCSEAVSSTFSFCLHWATMAWWDFGVVFGHRQGPGALLLEERKRARGRAAGPPSCPTVNKDEDSTGALAM